MRARLTQKYYAYVVIWAICAGVAAATGTPEPLVAGAPLLIALIAGLVARPAPRLEVEREDGATHVFEGDVVSASFTLSAGSDLPLVEAVFVLPSDATLTEGTNTVITSLAAGATKRFAFSFRLPSRRVTATGDLVLRITDVAGFTTWDERLPTTHRRTVFPGREVLSGSPIPAKTRVFAGAYPSAVTGEGLEFADVRSFSPGDRVSRINWNVVARTGRLHVNDFVTERNTDIVLLLDVFADPGPRGATLLDLECRAVATLAAHYLREKNRVGLIELGHRMRYLLPAPGMRAWYRMLEQLADTRVQTSFVTQEVGQIPPRVLPPQAFVIAVTGLVSPRFAEALGDLRARGFDVAVIAVPVAALVFRAVGAIPFRPHELRAASRLWKLEEDERLAELAEAGFAVAPWDGEQPIAAVVRDLEAIRRGRRHLR